MENRDLIVIKKDVNFFLECCKYSRKRHAICCINRNNGNVFHAIIKSQRDHEIKLEILKKYMKLCKNK